MASKIYSIGVRFSDREHQHILREAELCGVTKSEFIRQKALASYNLNSEGYKTIFDAIQRIIRKIENKIPPERKLNEAQ